MKRILKWPVAVDDKPHQIGGGPVVHVAIQGDEYVIQVWTLEDDSPPDPPRHALVIGTSQPVPARWEPIGSVMAAPFVWHVVRSPQ